MRYFTESNRITKVKAASAAAQTEVNSDSINMSADGGTEEVTFVTTFPAITAGATTTMKVEASADNSSWAEVDGVTHSVAADDDGQTFVSDVYVPKVTDNYLRCTITRTDEDVSIGEIYAIRSKLRDGVIEQDVANSVTSLAAISPADA